VNDDARQGAARAVGEHRHDLHGGGQARRSRQGHEHKGHAGHADVYRCRVWVTLSAGRLATGKDVPAYAKEGGVEPERETETFAELVLELDSARWAGTRFLLRAGKALSRRRKMATVRFRPAGDRANELRIGVDGPNDVSLRVTGGAPESALPLTLSATPPGPELPAYGRVLLDVLNGGSTLSIRGDEAEEAWRVVTPVLEGWASGAVPLAEYPAGSAGLPPRANAPTVHSRLDLRAGEASR
jgi:glucose-6-phosphate 1-dehydrogenase